MFYGVRKLSRALTKLSRNKGDTKVGCWEPLFEFWWGFSLKYFVPFALNFLIFFSLHNDLNTRYGDYHMFWQVAGFCFPIAGLLVFFISFCACNTPEPFDHDVNMAFDENDREGTGAEWNVGTSIPTKVDPNEKELELAENVELAKNDENAKSITAN